MARSLYARLSRRYRPQPTRLERREFLKLAFAASAGLLISSGTGFGRTTTLRGVGRGRRVTVVGAGFSGLACAYELLSAGYDVTVLDARNRVGGRVLSFSDFVSGKVVEGGGELIGSNHPTWVAYAKRDDDVQLNDLQEAVSSFIDPLDPNLLALQELAAVLSCSDKRYLPARYRDIDRGALLDEFARLKLVVGRH